MKKNIIPDFLIALLLLTFATPGLSLAQSALRMKTGTVTVENGMLLYDVAGRGAAIVFIHGGQMDRRMWDPQVDVFARRYRMIRYDVRGYGRSSLPTKPYSHVGDLYDLLKHLNVTRATLVGLSLGGIIATDFTLVHPEMVDGLILAGPGLGGFRESDETVARFWAIVEAARDSGLARAADLWLKDPYMVPAVENITCRDRIRQIVNDNAHCWLNNPMVERGFKPPAIERLGEIKVPLLLLVGDRDVKDIKNIVDTIAASVPTAKKEVIRGAGHILNMERPEEFNELVLSFLRNLYKEQR